MRVGARQRHRLGGILRAATVVGMSGALVATFSTAAGADTKAPANKSASKTIQVGTWGPETGEFSVVGQINEGMIAYMKGVNEHHLLGKYSVNVTFGNDQYNPSLTPGVVRSLVQKDKVAMVCAGVGTPNNTVVKSYLVSSGIANIAPGAGTPAIFRPVNKVEFGVNRPYQPEAAAMARYAMNTLHQTKIAIAYTKTTVGEPGLKGAQWELAKKGLKPVATVGFPVTTTDFASEAAALKASGATFVIVWAVSPPFPDLVNAAHEIGYDPQWGTPFFNMTEPGTQDATHGTLTGHSYYVGWTPALTDHPVVAAAKAQYPKAVSKGSVTALFLQGYMAGYVCTKVLKKAIGMKGGPTSSNILKAANHLKLGKFSPFDKGLKWTPRNHLANIPERIYEAVNHGFKSVTPFQLDPPAPLG